jgi:hypothetical protein
LIARNARDWAAKEKRGEALVNLQDQLEKESAVLVDPDWDAKEKKAWLLKVTEEMERETLRLDLEKLSLLPSPVPEPPRNLAVSQIENLSLELSDLLIDEGKSL